jgi:surfeit locus 1 family protein
MTAARTGFPWALTVAAALAIVALLGLGIWQVRRLEWKEGVLAKIAALTHAPARPLATVLVGGGAAEFMRVDAACAPAPSPSPAVGLYRYAVRDGRIGWRLLGACRLSAGPYDGILVDRGLIDRFAGLTSPQAATFPPVREVTGVLRKAGGTPWLGPALMETGAGFLAWRVIDPPSLAKAAATAGLTNPAPFLLAPPRPPPPAPGLTPAALPQDIPNNHLVYAITWFALAAIAAWFYGAMLISRSRG